MVSPAVIVKGWEVGIFFVGEQFPTDLSAGALTVKEVTKARLNLVPCGCARTHDSWYCLLTYPTDLHR